VSGLPKTEAELLLEKDAHKKAIIGKVYADYKIAKKMSDNPDLTLDKFLQVSDGLVAFWGYYMRVANRKVEEYNKAEASALIDQVHAFYEKYKKRTGKPSLSLREFLRENEAHAIFWTEYRQLTSGKKKNYNTGFKPKLITEPTAQPIEEPKIKEPKEPKEPKIKPIKEPKVKPIKEPKVKPIKELKEPKIKEPKEPKEPKIKPIKEPKVKPIKEPKVKPIKELKEPKIKEPKEPKIKPIKEPKVKPIKEPKVKPIKEPKIKPVKTLKAPKATRGASTETPAIDPVSDFNADDLDPKKGGDKS
jgi:hypothetical protein